MEQRVCPLRVLASKTGSAGWGLVNIKATACVGPARAWFDAAAERCAVLTMARGTR